MESKTMESKIALVTGASSGIGEATAARLAEAGYKVYGTSRRGAQAGQRPFQMLPLDVTSDDSVEAAVREVMRLDGRIDLLVNNAGFSVAPAGAEESSIAQAWSIFDTNFFGIVRMTRAVVPHMRHQGSGRIINIGSVLGFLPAPYMALYAATKHAIEGYSESLDHELPSKRVSRSVSPRSSPRDVRPFCYWVDYLARTGVRGGDAVNASSCRSLRIPASTR